METKAKLSTKALSIFLSLLMAFSCAYVALPALAPTALGADVAAAKWEALETAFTTAASAGYMSAGDWDTVATQSDGTLLIEDETINGYAYAVVAALGDILADLVTDEGKTHNATLPQEIAASLKAQTGYQLNPYQIAFLASVLPSDNDYDQYRPGQIWNGAQSDFDAFPDLQFTVVATRSEEAAVLMDQADLATVPETVEKTYTITLTASFVETDSTNGSETGGYYANTACTAAATSEPIGAGLKAHLDALSAYIKYVSTEAFRTGFDAYYAENENGSIDALVKRDKEDLAALVQEYLTSGLWANVQTTAPAMDASYIENYIGVDLMAKQKKYVDAVSDALAMADYRAYAEWIMNAEPIEGAVNKLDYTPTDVASLERVKAQAVTFKDAMNGADATVKEALNRVYGYTDAAFDDFIAELDGMIYNYYLQEIATATKTLLNNDHNTTYSFNSKEAYDMFHVPADSLGARYVKTGDARVEPGKSYYKAVVASEGYVKTADTEPDENKTYYVLAEDGETFTKVDEPSAVDIAGYYEYQVTYEYVKTTDTVLVSGKTYYVLAEDYTAVEEPDAENLGVYYEVKMEAVASPSTAEIGSYFEKQDIRYGLKGIGNADYLSANYDYAYSQVDTQTTPAPVSGVQYYLRGVYTAVASPVADDLGSYYEKSGNKYTRTEDTAVVSGKHYYTLTDPDKYVAVDVSSFADGAAYYTKDELPINDDDLLNLYTFFAQAQAYISRAEAAGVDISQYLESTQRTAIDDTVTALRDEQVSRGRVTAEFLTAYTDLYNKMTGYGVQGKSTADLLNDVGNTSLAGSFEKLYADLASSYNWFASDVRGTTARAFIDSIYVELYNRQVGAIQRILDDYNDNPAVPVVNGDKRNVRNYHQIKADATKINAEALSKLGESLAVAALNKAGLDRNKLNAAAAVNKTSDGRYTAQQLIDWANNDANKPSNVYAAVSGAQTTVIDGENNKTYITRAGKESDFARTTENYDWFTAFTGTNPNRPGVNVGIEDTIDKLDTLLTGQSFVNLLGVDERGKGIKNLEDYIKLVLVENLFTNEMVNTLVAALFPMLTDLFETTIANLIKEKAQPLDLGSLNIGYGVSGTVYVEFNGGSSGGHGTVTFANMLNQLGVNIYPEYFGAYLKGLNKGYNSIGETIRTADKYWTKFRETGAQVDENGKFVSDVEFKGQYAFDWGIDSVTGDTVAEQADRRFNKFCDVLGDIFGAALPLMQALFSTNDLSNDSVKNFAVAHADPIKAKPLFITYSAELYVYNIDIKLRVNNLNLYRTLWVPLMEALGVGGDIVSGYSFANLPGACTGAQLVSCLLDPVYALIKQISKQPLGSVTKLLPNLAYHLMNGSVNNLLNRHITFYIQGNDAELDGRGVMGTIVGAIGNVFSGPIAKAIKVEEAIELSSVLNLQEILGIDLTDLNTLITGIIGKIKEGADLHLPGIATGKLATMYRSITQTKSSQACNVSYNGDSKRESFPNRGNGQTYVYANSGVVFYYVFNYLFRAAQQAGVLSDILGGVSEAFGADINLPDIVFALIGGIESAPQAFVALMEFLNMDKAEYDLTEYDWYLGKDDPDKTYNFTAAPFAYTLYNNDWTVEKAQYLYDNVDELMNAVINMVDDSLLAPYDGDANKWLLAFVNQMFNNEGIMNVLELTIKVGEAMAGSPSIAKILRQQLTSNNPADGEFDLFAWYNKFGYLYREEALDEQIQALRTRTTVNADKQFLAYNVQNNQTYIYEATPEKNLDGTDKVINLLDNTNGKNATCSFKVVRAVAMAPGETVALMKDGDLIKTATVAHNTPYNKYASLFSNLQFVDYLDDEGNLKETSEDGDLLKQWKVRVTDANKDFLTGSSLGEWVTFVDGADNARNVFTAVFCELIRPLSIVFSFILAGKNLELLKTQYKDANGNFIQGRYASLDIKGYASYDYALIPLLEAIGVHDLKTGKEFKAIVEDNAQGAGGAFNTIVNQLFDAMTELLTDDRVYDAEGNVTSGKGPFQKVIDVLPHLFYFMQSGGLTSVIKNLPMFVWQIVDTLRPIVSVNLDDLIHALLPRVLGLVYDVDAANHENLTTTILDLIGMEAAPVSNAGLARDADKVNAIFNFSLKRLSLKDIFYLVEALLGFDLSPITYAFEGMSYNGVTQLAKKPAGVASSKMWQYTAYLPWADKNTTDDAKYKSYTINFEGRDTITVTISALIDLLTYEQMIDGKSRYINAEALDALLGTVKETLPGAQALLGDASAAGLIEAVVKVFEDKPFDGTMQRPNWDYVFENRTIPTKPNGDTFNWTNIDNTGETAVTSAGIYSDFTSKIAVADFHRLHYATMYNLHYVTDWQPETAQATVETLESVADYVVGLLDLEEMGLDPAEIHNFGDFADQFLRNNVFTADLLLQILDLIAKIYDILPLELRDVLDHLIDVDMHKWSDDGLVVFDYPYERQDDGSYIQNTEKDKVWIANRAYGWFVEGDSLYIDSLEKFLDAIETILAPTANLLSIIFLSRDYRLFHGYDNFDEAAAGNHDAIVLNGANAYAVGLIPILEAFNVDLTNYKPEKYYDATQTGVAQYKSDLFVHDLIQIIKTLVETIEANPIEWLLDVLPNLIYFLNANGLSTSLENIFGSISQVLTAVNQVADLGLDLNNIMGSGLDVTNLTLEGVFGLIYKLTSAYEDDGTLIPGLHLSDGLLEYIQKLYIGQIEGFTSANGFQSFRMTYSSEEDKADMITVLLSLVLEYATDSGSFIDKDYHGNRVEFNNAATLDRLIFGGKENEGLIENVIDALRHPDNLTYKDVDWFYFDETYNLAANQGSDDPAVPEVDDTGKVLNVKAWQFQYLNYRTKWTYDKALATATGLEDLIVELYNSFLKKEEDPEITKVGDIELLNIDKFFTSANMTKILEMLQGALFDGGGIKVTDKITLNMTMINFVGSLLGADLMPWCHTYAFADELTGTTAVDAETGLTYAMMPGKIAEKDAEGNYVYTDDGKLSLIDGEIKTYLINDRASFIKGLSLLLAPAQDLLSWLLFGDSYEFFTGNTSLTKNDVLITIQGSEGYGEGLVLLLEALGCKNLKMAKAYQYDDNGHKKYHTGEFIDDMLNSVVDRVEEILADPINQIVGLIPELIYFINAGGLQTVVSNLLAGPLALVNKLTSLMNDEQAAQADDAMTVVDNLLDGVISGALGGLEINGKTMADHKKTGEGEDAQLVHPLPAFKLDGINLEYIFNVVEAITDLEITDVIGNGQSIKNFYMGDIYRYMSMGGETKLAYRCQFSDEYDFADFITILISFVLDVALHDVDGEPVNADVIAGFLPMDNAEEIVDAVIKFIVEGYTTEISDINWLYFDPANNIYDENGKRNDKVITEDTRFVLPVRTINYLTYMSDWSEDLAHYIYENRNDLISKIMGMVMGDGDEKPIIEGTDVTISKIINGETKLADFGLFKAEYLQKLLDLIKNLLVDSETGKAKIPNAILELLNIIIDIDLTAYTKTGEDAIQVPEEIADANAFIDALCEIISPLYTVLDWLFFGNDLTYFDKNTEEEGYEVLLNLKGSQAYEYGLVPILEALGVECVPVAAGDTSEDIVPQLLKNIVARVDEILAAPVDELLALIPNLLYFINANGLAASVQNILAAPLALLDKINPVLGDNAIDINKLIGDLVKQISPDAEITVDLQHLELDAVLTILEKVLSSDTAKFQIFNALSDKDANGRTGLEKIKYFYFGGIEFEVSEANHLPRGKMVYTEDEDAADMLTIIVNFLVDLVLFENDEGSNAEAIEQLLINNGVDIKPGLITGIIDALGTLDAEPTYEDYHWNYFNEHAAGVNPDTIYNGLPESLPKTPFANYLTYPAGNRWTQNAANNLTDTLGSLVDMIIRLTLGKDNEDYQTLHDVISKNFNLYQGEYLQKILDLIQTNLDKYEGVLKLVGLVIGSDAEAIENWFKKDDNGDFVLKFTNDNVTNAAEFVDGLVQILSPIYPLLDWLFFGKDLAYFVAAADGNIIYEEDENGNLVVSRDKNELIRLAGSEGYKYGLVPLLTELGVDLPKVTEEKGELNSANYMKDILLAVFNRVDAILADPVNEALDLLPNLLYFINANGLSTMVKNLVGSLVGAVETVLNMDLFELPENFAGLKDGVYRFVADQFGIDIDNLDLEGLFSFVETLNVTDENPGGLLHGLKLNEVFTREFATDIGGLGYEENILERFYIGDRIVPVETGAGTLIYKLDLTEEHRGDVITTLISILLEVLFADVNEDPIIAILNNAIEGVTITKEGFHNLKALLMSGVEDGTFGEINWAYFLSDPELLTKAVSGELEDRDFAVPENVERTTNYLAYEHTNGTSINLWREDFARTLFEDLDGTVNQVLALINKDDPKTLSELIDGALASMLGNEDGTANLFTNEMGSKLVEAITGLFDNIELDTEILDKLLDVVGDLLGAENLSSIRTATFHMSDDASKPAATRFAEELGRILAPISGVIAWLFFGESYKFFTQLEDGTKAMINLNGVEGYKYAIAPILYALGVDTNITLTEKADGTPDYAQALTDILVRLATRIDELLYQDRLIDEVLALLPNLIYFINADGLTVCANNLLGSINPLLDAVGEMIGKEISIASLIPEDLGLVNEEGKLELNFNTIFKIVKDKFDITLSDEDGEPIGGYLTKFFFGKLESGISFDNLVNYRMVYSDEDTAYDLFTIVLELVLDVASYSGNANAIQKLLMDLGKMDEAKAQETYNAIMQLLYQDEYVKKVKMVPYRWAWTQYDIYGGGDEAGKILTPLNINGSAGTSLLDSDLYGPLYTKAMGEYMTKYLQLLIDTYITLLGIDNGKGGTYRNLDEILKNLVGDNIYKRSLLESIANGISGAINGLKDSIGEELFAKIVEILEEALDVDLNALLNPTIPANFREGDQASFVKAISQMLSPAAPLLRWLLTSQDIALFSTRDRNDYIVLRGADGYQNAIIPILEALTGGKPEENRDILTQAEYEARTNRPANSDASDAEKQAADTAMLELILNPILNRVNDILADPLNEIFNELPAVIYFINSKGLDSAFKNLLNPIFEILTVIEPLLKEVSFGDGKTLYKNGQPDLYGLIGLDLETLDMSELVNKLIGLINNSVDTGELKIGDLLSSSLGDLTLGVVKSFESKRLVPADSENAKPGATGIDNAKDYTMAYAGTGNIADTGSKVDMVTIILKIVLTFISDPSNVKVVENMLKGSLNENGYKFLCALLENFSQFAGTPGGQDKIMYTVYYIFYTAITAGVATNNGLASFNYNYSFLNQLFATSDVGFFRQLEASLGGLLDKWTPDVVDRDEVVPNGFIRFFQSIIDFFKKIGNFFRNLFKR